VRTKLKYTEKRKKLLCGFYVIKKHTKNIISIYFFPKSLLSRIRFSDWMSIFILNHKIIKNWHKLTPT